MELTREEDSALRGKRTKETATLRPHAATCGASYSTDE